MMVTLTGPLAGVPVAIKDNMCTKDLLTTCSSKILYNFKPTYTAEAVENLEKAGAVIIGKTNMDEFAMGSTTETSAYGVTKKSMESKLMSRVALPVVPVQRLQQKNAPMHLGSDTGGSIRQPSSFCGVTGIKANLWNRFPLWTDRLWFFTGSDRTDCKRCDRLCDNLGSDCFL